MTHRTGTRFIAAALGLGVLNLLIALLEVGARGVLWGGLMALLPVPIYAGLALWMDQHEREPLKMLTVTFVWGATIASFFSVLFNTTNALLAQAWVGEAKANVLAAVISAPLVEETSKGLALFLLFWWWRDEFDGVVDGILYAAMVGLGFAMTENVLYYGRGVAEGLDVALGTFVVRGILSPFAHPLFTAMTGLGLGLAHQSRRRSVKLLAPTGGLCLGIVLHSVWNLSASLDAWWGMYALIGVPTFAGMLLLIRFALRREAALVRAQLAPYVATGLLGEVDLDRIGTVRGRTRGTLHALWVGGIGGWRRDRAFRQTACELALHRWRVQSGISRGQAADDQRERDYLERLHSIRALKN